MSAAGPLRLEDVARCMAPHAPMYRWRPPVYQFVALEGLARLWDPKHRTALDVGGGTGLMAQTIKTLFALERVVSVDVTDRYLPSLDIETRTFEGVALPFASGAFDCVLLMNVLHHVPVAARPGLLRECRRVAGSGPLYIKDHVSTGRLDDVRLAALDLLGNLPFHGMVRARYLREPDWTHLADASGYEIGAPQSGAYRRGLSAWLFPNRLELSMRWQPKR